MLETNRKQKIRRESSRPAERAGSAGYLLAMRMPGHAVRADAARDFL